MIEIEFDDEVSKYTMRQVGKGWLGTLYIVRI